MLLLLRNTLLRHHQIKKARMLSAKTPPMTPAATATVERMALESGLAGVVVSLDSAAVVATEAATSLDRVCGEGTSFPTVGWTPGPATTGLVARMGRVEGEPSKKGVSEELAPWSRGDDSKVEKDEAMTASA